MITGSVFHAQGQFDRIIDCSYCVLADDTVNEILRTVDVFARESGLPTYDPKRQEGFWRHLVVRKGHFTEEYMVTFSVNTDYLNSEEVEDNAKISPLKVGKLGLAGEKKLQELKTSIPKLLSKFPQIKSLYLLSNNGKADIVAGEYELLSGSDTITEKILDKTFEIQPSSFFQTNSTGAEKLYTLVRDQIGEHQDVIYDLYAGTGTIGIITADLAEEVYSVELNVSSSEDNRRNVDLNGIDNVTVKNNKVEDFLWNIRPDRKAKTTLIVDPPRAGMHPSAPENLLKFEANQIIYVSCNPATLVRDITPLLEKYRVTHVQPVDMFPHTHHVETVVKLEKIT